MFPTRIFRNVVGSPAITSYARKNLRLIPLQVLGDWAKTFTKGLHLVSELLSSVFVGLQCNFSHCLEPQKCWIGQWTLNKMHFPWGLASVSTILRFEAAWVDVTLRIEDWKKRFSLETPTLFLYVVSSCLPRDGHRWVTTLDKINERLLTLPGGTTDDTAQLNLKCPNDFSYSTALKCYLIGVSSCMLSP